MYLLIVTGLSGAGKSLALRCLEEQGYFCVDNLPSSMLKEFVNLCRAAQPAIQRAAVTIDSRESLLSHSADAITAAFDALGVSDRTEAVYAAAELGLALRTLPTAG